MIRPPPSFVTNTKIRVSCHLFATLEATAALCPRVSTTRSMHFSVFFPLAFSTYTTRSGDFFFTESGDVGTKIVNVRFVSSAKEASLWEKS